MSKPSQEDIDAVRTVVSTAHRQRAYVHMEGQWLIIELDSITVHNHLHSGHIVIEDSETGVVIMENRRSW